jgi:hypothetical protein
MAKYGPGRPPKPRKEKQSCTVAVRITPPEHKLLKADAVSAGKSRAAVLLDSWRRVRGGGK